MDYQNYEDYMREVLGYKNNNYTNMPNDDIYATNTYSQETEYFYEMPQLQQMNIINNMNTEEELNTLYPEIYKIIYPMVCKICNQHSNKKITKELLDNMVIEIYNNVEPEEKTNTITIKQQLRNGDVRNPNSKEPEVKSETRQGNYLMQDLIRILLLKELTRPGRPPMRPPYGPPPPPRPPVRPGPGPRPPQPPPPRPY